jgi:hypothetical protein
MIAPFSSVAPAEVPSIDTLAPEHFFYGAVA